MLRGHDISQHQATFPNTPGMSFVVLRASIGTTKDTMYDSHYAKARAQGLVVMAYHFNGPSGTPIQPQVDTFLAVAKDADFLWLDQEIYSSSRDIKGFTDAEAQQFIDAVRRFGRPCGLYHSASGFGGVNCDAKWVADWRDASEAAGYPRTADGTKEFPGWDLWQYDGAGADNLDNNCLNPDSTLARLLRMGYVTKASSESAIFNLEFQIAGLNARIEDYETAMAVLEAQKRQLEQDLVAAQVAAMEAARVEKARIAENFGKLQKGLIENM